MVIGSSSIGMESARRFTYVSMDASRMMTGAVWTGYQVGRNNERDR